MRPLIVTDMKDKCSFCGASGHRSSVALVQGPNVSICHACIAFMYDGIVNHGPSDALPTAGDSNARRFGGEAFGKEPAGDEETPADSTSP
jgi:hypothetical protein